MSKWKCAALQGRIHQLSFQLRSEATLGLDSARMGVSLWAPCAIETKTKLRVYGKSELVKHTDIRFVGSVNGWTARSTCHLKVPETEKPWKQPTGWNACKVNSILGLEFEFWHHQALFLLENLPSHLWFVHTLSIHAWETLFDNTCEQCNTSKGMVAAKIKKALMVFPAGKAGFALLFTILRYGGLFDQFKLMEQ